MKDVIDEIIKIDNFTYENKQKNEEALLNKKQEYEALIDNYKKEKIEFAKKNADKITTDMDFIIKKDELLQKEKLKSVSIELDKKFKQKENDLTKRLISMLFESEE